MSDKAVYLYTQRSIKNNLTEEVKLNDDRFIQIDKEKVTDIMLSLFDFIYANKEKMIIFSDRISDAFGIPKQITGAPESFMDQYIHPDYHGCLREIFDKADNGERKAGVEVQDINKEHWFKIVLETAEKDENGKVDHELANIISTSFSEASSGMSTDGQLNVYQHYNPTGYAIEDTPSSETQSNNPGMITKVGCKGNDNSIIKHLYVRLKNNRTPNRNGDALCDNADEIVNAYIHENDHIEKALKMGYKKWYELNQTNEGKRAVEISAIAAQRAHSSWSGCRDSFKKGVERYEKQF